MLQGVAYFDDTDSYPHSTHVSLRQVKEKYSSRFLTSILFDLFHQNDGTLSVKKCFTLLVFHNNMCSLR